MEGILCSICDHVLVDPVKCGNCPEMYCRRCLSDKKIKGAGGFECPACKVVKSYMIPKAKDLKQLTESQYECYHCAKVFEY